MHVIDPILKLSNESGRLHPLPLQMAWIEVKSKGRPPPDRVKRTFRTDNIERNLRGVHLKGETNATLVKDVKNRTPKTGESCIPFVDDLCRHRRKPIDQMPNGRTRKPTDNRHPEIACRASRILHRLNGPLAFRFRISVKRRGRKGIRSRIVGVADQLACQVVADGKHLQSMLGQHLETALGIRLVFGRAVDVHVIAPAR